MTFLNKYFRFGAALALALLLFTVFSCDFPFNITTEDGHTYINVQKDTAWVKFDTLDISWKDSVAGTSGTLFHGNPAELSATNKLLADGYQGQKIVVSIKGYTGKTLTYEERRVFDGANPGTATKEIIPIVVVTPIDSPISSIPKPKSPKLSAIKAAPDSIVSINDSISFLASATLDSGSLKNYSWSYEAKDAYETVSPISGRSVQISGGHRYSQAGDYHCVLKVRTEADSIVISQIDIQVLQDLPVSDAGKDATVYTNSTVKLHGAGKDKLGHIVKTEWKIGAGDFFVASLDTSFQAPSFVQDITVQLRVTDDDGQAVVDSLFIHVVSETESNLTALGVSQGVLSPQFSPGVLVYSDTVANDVATLSLKPEGSGTIKVNGVVVASGEFSKPMDLAVGSDTLSASVQFGSTPIKSYSVIVYRMPVSMNADLAALEISAGVLSPSFSSGDTLYNVYAAAAIATTTVRATLADTASTLTVNGFRVASKTVSGNINLALGKNNINIEVTSRGGAKKSYVLQVTRAAGNENVELSGLVPSIGTLTPDFLPTVSNYSFQTGFSDSLVRVTPTVSDPHSTAQVNVKSTTSGTASDFQKVQVGSNPNVFSIVVTAENLSQKVYYVSVNRLPNTLSTLKSMVISAGKLVQTNPLEYADTLAHGISNVTLTALASDPNSFITVNGSVVASNAPSDNVPLKVGDNSINCVVTAQDGTTQSHYTVHVVRLAMLTRIRNSGSVLTVIDSVEIPLGTAYALSAPGYPGIHFVKWETVDGTAVFGDAGTATTSVTLSLGDAHIQADYETNIYDVTVNATNCTVAKSPNQSTFTHGTSVTFTVSPSSGYQFPTWSDGSTENPRTISIVATTTLSVACTAIPVYTLALGVSPVGSGSVAPSTVNPNYLSGTTLSLTPTPEAGYHFVNWTVDLTGSANPGSITMTGNKNITAVFALNQYSVTIANDGNGETGPTGIVTATHGVAFSIGATVNAHSVFSSWSVTGPASVQSSTSASTNVTVTGPGATVTANFKRNTYTLTVGTSPCGASSPSGPTTVVDGVGTTVTAISSCNVPISATCGLTGQQIIIGYTFTGWTITPSSASLSVTTNPTVVTLTKENATLSSSYSSAPTNCH